MGQPASPSGRLADQCHPSYDIGRFAGSQPQQRSFCTFLSTKPRGLLKLGVQSCQNSTLELAPEISSGATHKTHGLSLTPSRHFRRELPTVASASSFGAESAKPNRCVVCVVRESCVFTASHPSGSEPPVVIMILQCISHFYHYSVTYLIHHARAILLPLRSYS